MKTLLRLFPYVRADSGRAWATIGLTVLFAAVGILAPWPMKVLIDYVLQEIPLPPAFASVLGPLGESRFALMIAAVAAGFLFTVLTGVLDVLTKMVTTRLQQGIVLGFRSDLFQHAQRLSMSYHERRRTGHLIAAITSRSNSAGSLVMMLPSLLSSVLTLVGMFAVALSLHWKLTLISTVVVPWIYLSMNYYTKRIKPLIKQVKRMEGDTIAIVYESLSMFRVIAAFVREQHEYRRFRKQGETALDARVDLTRRQTVFSLLINSGTSLGTTVVLGFGAYAVMTGELTVGTLLVFMSYIASVYGPLESISGAFSSMNEKVVGLNLAFKLLDMKPEIRDRPGAQALKNVRGEVRFEEVRFSYLDRPDVLRDISFTAPAGKITAIVAPTGAGKTTLVSLLPRFYEAQGGRILIDGKDIRDVKYRSLRRNISIVLQEPLLFSGTIKENIRYGRLNASSEEIVSVAQAAGAHDFIMKLPAKYETRLGERGATLSGGERQRVSIARAFLKDAPILILDEPTASVDSKTEAGILDALDRLMAGRTTFLIAHRLSTVRGAHQILVLDNGRLVEQGSEEELLARGGLYAQLHAAQTGGARPRSQPTVSVWVKDRDHPVLKGGP